MPVVRSKQAIRIVRQAELCEFGPCATGRCQSDLHFGTAVQATPMRCLRARLLSRGFGVSIGFRHEPQPVQVALRRG